MKTNTLNSNWCYLAGALAAVLLIGSVRWYSKLHPNKAGDAWANFKAQLRYETPQRDATMPRVEADPVIEHEPKNLAVNIPTITPNGLPSNVVIRSDGTRFAWDDTNPNRLWDSTLVGYGLHVKFNTYQEALDSAKKYVSEMNADAERGRKISEEAQKGKDVASWPILK